MIEIGAVAVDDAVRAAAFCCDLDACKGACCCIEGGRGAPLERAEAVEIAKALPLARRYLSGRSIEVIEQFGAMSGEPGDLATTCIDDRECVFVFFDKGIARCALERAFLEGLTTWRKPISCHLFPIRIRRWGRERVVYEQIPECYGGRARGERERVPLVAFLREPLIRTYGDAWFAMLVSDGREAG